MNKPSLAEIARRNRLEIVKAGLSRREMMQMGLLTSGGYLVLKKGLSARASWAKDGVSGKGGDNLPATTVVSPPTRPFVVPLPRMPVKEPTTVRTGPDCTKAPNTLSGEARFIPHQAFDLYPYAKYYEVHQRLAQVSVHPDLPVQQLWGFDGIVPGPTYVARYGEPIMVRNFNDLPANNGGFGRPSVSTHLHNGHTPPESDGFPCYYMERGQFYDHHYPNVLAGCLSTHVATGGDIRESLSTLWYHDHRIDFTAQNVYKGLAGFFLLFNEFDTGDETTGFRLPSGEYDVPLMFGDRVFAPDTGLMYFDLFNLDGIIGDKFLVNGVIQPVMQVAPRRYRLRWLNGGPSRFYQFFFTDAANPTKAIKFWQISNDGNLLPAPLEVPSVRIAVAQRCDIIIDFSQFRPGSQIYLENRLQQTNGRGPTDFIFPATNGNYVMRFDVVLPAVADDSKDPATITKFYDLPDPVTAPLVTRTFNFERKNGQWAVNGKFASCAETRFRARRNTQERWILRNNSGGWQHPVHIHFEEFQIASRNGVLPPPHERGRNDVLRLGFNEEVVLNFRFRDFYGRLPMHCHNVVHEDHAMMVLWEINDNGDTNPNP